MLIFSNKKIQVWTIQLPQEEQQNLHEKGLQENNVLRFYKFEDVNRSYVRTDVLKSIKIFREIYGTFYIIFIRGSRMVTVFSV